MLELEMEITYRTDASLRMFILVWRLWMAFADNTNQPAVTESHALPHIGRALVLAEERRNFCMECDYFASIVDFYSSCPLTTIESRVARGRSRRLDGEWVRARGRGAEGRVRPCPRAAGRGPCRAARRPGGRACARTPRSAPTARAAEHAQHRQAPPRRRQQQRTSIAASQQPRHRHADARRLRCKHTGATRRYRTVSDSAGRWQKEHNGRICGALGSPST
ncbi:Protein of unknown function [Gryllus bimaculatus]|nr:Protein of unknown function [Gryllus bimaculatus]